MFKRIRSFFRDLAMPASHVSVLSVLHVNSSTEPEQLRVNLSATVNNAQIRRGVMHNGRPHTVIPSYTLPDDVIMNGLLYPHAEIEKSYKGLEGKLAPLGHPTLDGVYVPANTPEAINAHHIGAFNRDVERRGNRIYVSKWIDEEYAANTEGGRKLLEALDKGEPIHTSTGIFLQADLTANGKSANGKAYRGTARNMVMDHDAILIGEIGAATPDDGVGLMVNNLRVEDATPLTLNEQGMFDRFLQWLKLGVNSEPDTTPTAEGENDMDRKELDEALAANAKTQGEALEKLFAPIADRLAKLETNQQALSDSLTANSRAAEAEKRSVVAEKLGQEVADALTGNALDQAHAKLVGAAGIVSGFTGNRLEDGKFKQTQLPE